METDARGQLGGMDTTDDMRRRFAEDSRTFKCSTCGRSNLDIILEAEKNAKEISSATEVQIPAELRMGWRNEADAVKEAPARGHIDVTKADDSNADTETAELAEGFVQTSSSIRPAHEDVPAPLRHVFENTTSIASGIRQRDGTALGLTVQSENTVNNTRPATTQPPSDGIPLWIDRAIVALVICLAAMLFKVLFGL